MSEYFYCGQGRMVNYHMRCSLLLFLTFLFFLLPFSAQAAYVTDNFNITLRAEPLKEANVISLLKNGARLEVMEENEDWVHVKTEDGKEGWIVKRYLSQELPQAIRIERLKKDLDETSIKLKVTAEKSAQIEKENKNLKQDLDIAQRKLNKVESDYNQLQADAGNVVEIKKNYDESKTNLSMAMARNERLQAENNELRSTTELRWFLTGAGVVTGALLFGFILGRINRGKRHHPSFL